MRRQIACIAALVAVSTTLAGGGVAAAASAGASGTSGDVAVNGSFKCSPWERIGVTDRRTAVHVGMSASSKVTGHIAKGKKIKLYYRCVTSDGEAWYEITGDMEDAPRFIWPGNV